MKRRDFFKLMGIASGAALTACNSNPDEKLLPYLVPPEEDIIPGVPHYSRSTCMECPAMCGLDIKIRDGKPVKLEGNIHHPINNGRLCIRGQASLARLYHPDRIKQPMLKDPNGNWKPISWQEGFKLFSESLEEADKKGLRKVYLSSLTTGSLGKLIDEFCREKKIERLKEVEIFHHSQLKEAGRQVFDREMVPHYRMDQSDLLITIGADIFETFISPVEWMQQYAEAKRAGAEWIHMEPYTSLTGVSAKKRMSIHSGKEYYLLGYLLHNLPRRQALPETFLAEIPNLEIEKVELLTGLKADTIKELTDALTKAKQPLIISGGTAVTTANGKLAAIYTALLQWSLGMIGTTVQYDRGYHFETLGAGSDLSAYMKSCYAGEVGFAVYSRMYGIDIYKGFEECMAKVPFKVAFSQMPNSITNQCNLILPLSNPLESWGDAAPRLDIKSVIQPVIKPMHDTKCEGEILLQLMNKETTYRDYLSTQWQGVGEDFIEKGFIQEYKESVPTIVQGKTIEGKPARVDGDDILFIVPSIRTYDGRSGDINLLKEIPAPMTNISYSKFLSISPEEAKRMELEQGDIVDVKLPHSNLVLACVLAPSFPLGMRTVEFDALQGLRIPYNEEMGQFQFYFENVQLKPSGNKAKLTNLSGSKKTGNRSIIPGYEDHDAHSQHHEYKRHTLYKPHPHTDYRWGMVIDLDICTGCSACVAACYIENNIPMVGQAEQLKGREMAWLRIETYYDDNQQPEFLPMMCQQCDNAPCETVCPVYATYHNPEGLNAQIYNRCVGTRYCANNCPYKARRFNWFDFKSAQPLYSTSNPDLSVRPAGVMEKCTFCSQRIRLAKDQAKDEKRLVKDGEVMPACAQTCPAGAIVFGNLMDPESKVSQLAKEAGAYRVQELLGTEPAVYYIKRNQEKKS